MTYKVIAIFILVSMLAGSGYYMMNKIESQAVTIGELTTTLETTTSRLNSIEASISDFKEETSKYTATNDKASRELSVRLNKLDSNVKRGQTAIDKKPKLVEKAIQKDYVEFGSRMDCITMGECK